MSKKVPKFEESSEEKGGPGRKKKAKSSEYFKLKYLPLHVRFSPTFLSKYNLSIYFYIGFGKIFMF